MGARECEQNSDDFFIFPIFELKFDHHMEEKLSEEFNVNNLQDFSIQLSPSVVKNDFFPRHIAIQTCV